MTAMLFHLEKSIFFIFANLKKMMSDVIHTKFMRLIWYFFPIVILILNLFLHLFVTLRVAEINYDEFVLVAISKQSLTELLDTTKAEPHPLGFYFLLRAFDSAGLNTPEIRVVVTILFHVLLILTTLLAYRTKLVEKLHLKIGLSLAFSSFSIFEIGCQIKQDVVSFPLFYLFFISALSLLFVKPLRKTWVLALLVLASCVGLVFLSYLYFVFVTASLTTFLILSALKKDRRLGVFFFSCLTVMVTLFTLYYFAFGHFQIENNYLIKNRFLWTKDIPNSFIHQLPAISAGVRLFDPLSDIFTFFLFSLFFHSINRQRKTLQTNFSFFIVLFVLYLAISYSLRLFVQSRYAVPTFLLFFLVIGHTASMQKKIKALLIGTIFVMLYTRSASLFISSINNTLGFQELNRSFATLSPSENIGITSNVPGVPVYIKVRFLSNFNHVFPISTSKNTNVIPSYDFNRQHFNESSEILEKTPEELITEFQGLKFIKFIYVESLHSAYEYYDPEKRVQTALQSMCKTETPLDQFDNATVYIYSDCQ